MRREAETDALLTLQSIFILPLPDSVGDIHQLLSNGLRYLLGYPSRIACT